MIRPGNFKTVLLKRTTYQTTTTFTGKSVFLFLMRHESIIMGQRRMNHLKTDFCFLSMLH